MAPGFPGAAPRDADAGPRAAVVSDVVATVAAAGAVAILVAWSAGLGSFYVVKTVLASAVCLQGLRALIGPLARVARFTAADRVTLARVALAMPALALLGEMPQADVAALAVVLTGVAALLDAVDGRVARRQGNASVFGARFDMEADALLVLVLSLLAWHWDKAGAWILLAGLARYLFLGARRFAPWLAHDLPPSRRRQAVCVIQVVALIACIAPWVAPPASTAVAAIGLAALGASFAIDVRLLSRLAAGRR